MKIINRCVFNLFAAILIAASSFTTLRADDGKSLPKEGIAISPDFNPWDKLLGIDMAVPAQQLNWGALYSNTAVTTIDPSKLSDKDVAIPFALGVKICDGLLAIKAKDKEKLNECSEVIEALAKKMGVTDAELVKAKEIKLYANNQEWLRVVLELGMLKKSIVESIDRSVGPDARRIIMMSGWLQGVRYISSMVSEHYNDNTAGIMREPMIVKHLLAEFAKIPQEKSNSEIGKLLQQSAVELGKLVNVPMDGKLSEEAVKQAKAAADKAIIDSLNVVK